MFTLDKPLYAGSYLNRVQLMAKSVGFSGKITSYSLRQGAMQDLANTKAQPHAISNASAATLAGYLKAIRDRGITRQYIRDTEEDLFAIQVEKLFISKRAPFILIPPAAIYNTLHISPGHGIILQAPKDIAGNDKNDGIDDDVKGFQLPELDTMMAGRVESTEHEQLPNQADPATTSLLDHDNAMSITDTPLCSTVYSVEQDVIMQSDAITAIPSNDGSDLVEELASAFCSDTVSAAQQDLDMLVKSEQDDYHPPPASHVTNTDVLDGDFDEFVAFFSRINAVKMDKRLATDSICGNSRE